jgi:hypothetical protein
MPVHPPRQETVHEWFSMAEGGTARITQLCAQTPLCGQAYGIAEDARPAKMLLRCVAVGQQAITLNTSSLSGCVQVSADPKANDQRLCW